MMTIEYQASAVLPTRFGDFRLEAFRDGKGDEHIALIAGNPIDGCLVRLHSECATGDVLGSLRCDCRDQLELSLHMIQTAGAGIFIYLRGHEGRGIGLANKIKAYALQDKGLDTVEANVSLGFAPDERDYDAAVEILHHYGVKKVRLLTNNRHKIHALEEAGIQTEQVPLWAASNPHNENYLDTKQKRLGHIEPAQINRIKKWKSA
jgi:GTP cyclohydrolase II